MKRILLFIVFSFIVLSSFAQYNTHRNMVWMFGKHAGIDFNSGAPISISNSGIDTWEGCATVCDDQGKLLFYTDGKKIFDRRGNRMPSSANIVPFETQSTTQGALIVPVIGSTHLYYVFSLENFEPQFNVNSTGKLAYSIVDMNMNEGLSDLLSGKTGIPMGDGFAEKMIAIPGDKNNVWLVLQRRDSTMFWVYNITESGISGPVISGSQDHQPIKDENVPGVIKASPDGRLIVCLTEFARGIRLFDFDPATGIASNRRALDTVSNAYGAEFSPDNKKLYTIDGSAVITQYDISLNNIADIIASATPIGSAYGDLKLAPDDKIYIANFERNYLSCISNPNGKGVACSFKKEAVKLDNGFCRLGLPNTVVVPFVAKESVSVYPNPNRGNFFFSHTGPDEGQVRIVITDMLGRQVGEQYSIANRITNVKLNAAEGIYFLQAYIGEKRFSDKIMVLQ